MLKSLDGLPSEQAVRIVALELAVKSMERAHSDYDWRGDEIVERAGEFEAFIHDGVPVGEQ